MTSREASIETIKRWLRSKHCTLWMNWDITGDSGLTTAATWMYDTMEEVVSFHEQEIAAAWSED